MQTFSRDRGSVLWLDRPGVRQVPEGSGEQEKMEKTGCKIICGAPTTLAVKGLMMMMMMMMMMMWWLGGTTVYGGLCCCFCCCCCYLASLFPPSRLFLFFCFESSSVLFLAASLFLYQIFLFVRLCWSTMSGRVFSLFVFSGESDLKFSIFCEKQRMSYWVGCNLSDYVSFLFLCLFSLKRRP